LLLKFEENIKFIFTFGGWLRADFIDKVDWPKWKKKSLKLQFLFSNTEKSDLLLFVINYLNIDVGLEWIGQNKRAA